MDPARFPLVSGGRWCCGPRHCVSLHLTLPEFVCLGILSMEPGLSSAELARRTSVSPQAIDAVSRKLEDIGAAAWPGSVSSGRALPATLTGQGRTLLTCADAVVHAANDGILATLTSAQQREFNRMLQRLDFA